MHIAIKERKDEISEICRRYRVSLLEVFGSTARSSDFDVKSSDAAFVVEFQEIDKRYLLRQFFGFRREVSNVLGRLVDLVEVGAVDNRYIHAAIDRPRELVYEE